MNATYDAIVVGGGHNGLCAAAYLARAGRSVLVLERRETLGGAAVTEEVWPGWNVSTASYVCSLLHPQIIADLELRAFGYDAYRKDPASFTPLHDGRSLLLGLDAAANAREIAAFDPADVAGFEAFEREATRLGSVVADALDCADARDARIDAADWKRLQGSVAELIEPYVRTPVLQATLATDGLIGTRAGPYDAGTAFVFAYHYAGRALGVQGAWGFVRGGMGAISRALAASARAHGAMLLTGRSVRRILTRDGRACGVVLDDGAEFRADVVLSNADPQTTFGRLLEPADVPAQVTERLSGWKADGVSLKVNLALADLPDFIARPGTLPQPHHRATVHVAPDLAYLQTAFADAERSGTSREPMLECFLQTTTDETLVPPGRHLLSVFAQYFNYERADGPWSAQRREAAGDAVVELLARYAPNLPGIIEARQVLTPPDLEERFGLPRGHIFHGELLPGQVLAQRFPARSGIDGLYLCGSGAHPGGCVSGIPGKYAAEAVLADSLATPAHV